MTLGTLMTYLKMNTSNFTSQLGKAQSQMSKFAKNMRSSMTAAAGSVKGLGGSYKDVSKIVQGIFVSKAIYGTMNAITSCTDAVWQFRSELEYAEMAYSNLFGSTELAKEFINVLEDAAAVSPFQFGDIEAAAKRLKAYGIQTENLMYVTQGVMTAASAQGNPAAIESISRALGQIYTKGSLKAEEARQLAEAGIPVYEILAERLGLTQEQLGNLADQAIPASTAINALVDGINDRFGGILNQSSYTMSGLVSNIVDNLKMIGSDAINPVFQGIKKILMDVNEGLISIRETLSTKGIGGLFERLIPPEMQDSVRLLVANLLVLGRTIAQLGNVMKNMFLAALPTIVNFLNIFLSTLNAIFSPLIEIVNIVTSDAAALKLLSSALAICATMWVVWKAKALAAMVVAGLAKVFHGLTTAVASFTKALTWLIAHPAWMFLALAGGIFLAVAGYSEKLRNGLNGVLKSLTGISGINSDELLLPSQEERANDLDKFNKKLDGTSDAMDDLADSTGKATKAAKGLLAFDEVFKLNEPDEGTNAGISDITIPEIDMGEGLDLGSWMPEDLEFDLFGENFAQKIGNALKEKFLSAGIGALIGGLLGGILGGPLGVKIGSVAGAIAGLFWDKIAQALNLTDAGKIALPISTGIGAIIGAIAGGPLGAAVGGAIGALVGWLVESISRGIQNQDWSTVAYPLGIGIGGAIGFLVGGPGGAAIGAAVGALVGWVTDLIISNWDSIVKWFSNVGDAIGLWITDTAESYNQWATDVERRVNTWADNTWKSFTTWVSDTRKAVKDWASGCVNSYNEWATKTEKSVNDWANRTWTKFTTSISNVGKTISKGLNDMYYSFKNWADKLWDKVFGKFFGWIDDGIQKLKEFFKLDEKSSSISTTKTTGTKSVNVGHATGGIFNREHIARFAEGNKAEAIIPLENAGAMQPFVDAVADGLAQTLGPIIASLGNNGGTQQLQPLYVGTLIADDRGLKELNRKMQVIQLQEERRR